MPLDAPVAFRVDQLNQRYRHHAATAVLDRALHDPEVGRIALVSSFGAESVVLLHMVSLVNKATPVLFIDTEMLFPETLTYQAEVADRLGLSNIITVKARTETLAFEDPDNTLHLFSSDACCAIRKTEPLERALAPYGAWITGRKRFQGSTRAALDFFEAEGDIRIKVNPLAHWGREDIADYMVNNRLPRHPLVARGYPSIGCAPCTSPVAAGEDPRSGRWRGQSKNECGIHFINGKVVKSAPQADAGRTPHQQGERSMSVIVTDHGFTPASLTLDAVTPETLAGSNSNGLTLDLPQTASLGDILPHLDRVALIRVAFPAFNDGRGFTLARRLRLAGYKGRLHAKGPVIADQYAMARRAGFDAVEIPAELAARQPAEHWAFRADWQSHDYQSRLRARAAARSTSIAAE